LTTTVATYNTTAGLTTVISGDLAYLRPQDIIKVKREGVLYDKIITGTPTERQFLYTSAQGKLTFGTAHGTGAKVYVLYQH
jgi:hypothetical protein